MDISNLPVAWANYISIFGFVLLAILIWSIPLPKIFADATDHSRWRDIRIWASGLIALQVSIYILFS